MRILKTRIFDRWANNEGLTDKVLSDAVDEIERGLVDAVLGGHVYKKRVALPGHGKRGGSRTLLAYQSKAKAFFIFGFAKNERGNINAKELKALKLLANELLGYSNKKLVQAIKINELIETVAEEDE
jgi:hypothetical protein